MRENLTNEGKGRPKGCKNKFTSLKDAFLHAFESIGGEAALAEWAVKPQNRPTFYQLIARMLPNKTEVTGDNGRPIEVKIVSYKDAE